MYDLLEKVEIRGFVICAVEGYSIDFVCSSANVNEYNQGKAVTPLEWKSRNNLFRFQRSLLRLVNCWFQPFLNSQVEFKWNSKVRYYFVFCLM